MTVREILGPYLDLTHAYLQWNIIGSIQFSKYKTPDWDASKQSSLFSQYKHLRIRHILVKWEKKEKKSSLNIWVHRRRRKSTREYHQRIWSLCWHRSEYIYRTFDLFCHTDKFRKGVLAQQEKRFFIRNEQIKHFSWNLSCLENNIIDMERKFYELMKSVIWLWK